VKDDKKPQADDIALFRYKVITPMLNALPGSVNALARTLSSQLYEIPGSTRGRIARTTMLDWKKNYDQGGLEALKPKERRDRNRPRRLDADLTEGLIAIKQGNPDLSVRMVIQEAYRSGLADPSTHLPKSSVHRMLRREGLMVKTDAQTVQDHRRFAYEYAGEMWQTDALHGPRVKDERGRNRKTYLLALLDDATRVIPYAEFAFGESVRDFLPVLRQGIERRGIPKRLFADNGAAYRSKQLDMVCAKLGIALIHARPYSPTSKGKIERWLRRVRQQLLSTLGSEDLGSLEALNRRFRCWVENEYHHTGHYGLECMTPLDCWASGAEQVRYLEGGVDIDNIFMFETTRKVKKDRTVQLHSRVYEVDAQLVGEIVTLRYDPAAPPSRPLKVYYQNEALGEAKLVDVHANALVKRSGPVQSLAFRKHKDSVRERD